MKKAIAKARDPARREKIAASRRGKKTHLAVQAALRKAVRGRKRIAETRRKMSDAHNRRRTVPPGAKKRLKEGERRQLHDNEYTRD